MTYHSADFIYSFFIIHISISLVIAVVIALYLQKRFQNSAKGIFLFMFLFNFSLPLIGYISSIWIAYYLKNVRYRTEDKKTFFLDLELFEYDFINIQREFGEGSIQDMLLNKYIPTEKKIKALVSLAENISQNNIHIIKNTLTSSDDEVRLYCFAIIDKIEKNINSKIYTTLNSFKSSTDNMARGNLAKELAFLYWEMIYYELSDDSLQDYILKEVKHYITIAQNYYANDPKLCILLGRIYMFQEDYSNATEQFERAKKLSSYELDFLMPYSAEINFLTANYGVVKSLMRQANGLSLNSKLSPIVEQWKAY